jgi:hypothetical protein
MANAGAVFALFLIARDNTSWHIGKMKLRIGRAALAPVQGIELLCEEQPKLWEIILRGQHHPGEKTP